eukprot:UN25134
MATFLIVAYCIRYLNKTVWKGEIQHKTLYLRKLDLDTIKDYSRSNRNVFVREFNVVFNAIVTPVDFGVMKYCDEDLKILAEQEYGHSKMQNDHQKHQRKLGTDRTYLWCWYWWLLDLLLLRVGKTVGISSTGYIESSAYSIAYYPFAVKFIEPYMDNAILFHFFEEIEHDQITVSDLKKKNNFLADTVMLPVSWVLYTVWIYGSIIMVYA